MDQLQIGLEELVKRGVPGAFVYTEDGQGNSCFFTAGVSNHKTGRRMSPDSRYRVGSTTKTFTAVVTLQLVVEGKLSLNDTMKKSLPDLPIPNRQELTIEHLLRMRSGLFDFEDDESLLGSLEAHLKPVTLRKTIDLSIKHPANFLPGAKYSYCNTNFCVLERIIERVTQRSLAQEMEQRIFKPLGMSDTSYPAEDDLTLPEPYIRGYEWIDGKWRECSEIFFGRGDGALISTALDLSRFFRALLIERCLLPDSLLQQMMTVVPDDPPADKAYGFGLIADKLPCGTVWGHSGAGFGYRNLPFLQLETGRFAVFMLNGTYGFRKASPGFEPPNFSNELRCLAYSKT